MNKWLRLFSQYKSIVQIMAKWIVRGELNSNLKICLSFYHYANRELGVVSESTKCFWRFRGSWSEWRPLFQSFKKHLKCLQFAPVVSINADIQLKLEITWLTPCLLDKCPLCPPSLKPHSYMLNAGLVKTHDSCRQQREVLMFHWSRSGVVMLWLYNDWVFILGQAVPLISHCHW